MTLAASRFDVRGAMHPRLNHPFVNRRDNVEHLGRLARNDLDNVASVWTLSPGLLRSGEYPRKKSSPQRRPELSARIGAQNYSVTPGYTVDSNTTMSPFFR
jgi:hypothetical protein